MQLLFIGGVIYGGRLCPSPLAVVCHSLEAHGDGSVSVFYGLLLARLLVGLYGVIYKRGGAVYFLRSLSHAVKQLHGLDITINDVAQKIVLHQSRRLAVASLVALFVG